MPNEQKTPLTVELNVDSKTGDATLALSVAGPDNMVEAFTHTNLLELLEEHDVGDWSLIDGHIEKALRSFEKGVSGNHIVAKRLDATFKININPDNMKASLSFEPAKGGQPITSDAVLTQLTELKIVDTCIDNDAIASLTTQKEPIVLTIARGTPPKPGKNSYFKKLIDIQENSAIAVTDEDDDSPIDFLAGKEYINVPVGQPLIKRLPPTEGEDGQDIFGHAIEATDGQEVPFAKDLTGTEFSEEDPDLLIAAIAGHPVLLADGARVDEIMYFKQIDRSVGHVTFDGSIHVAGDVSPDIIIDVSGDVVIKGMVERATIKAGNDIIVGMGITGEPENEEDVAEAIESPEFECLAEAGGIIQARYVNLASLKAKGNIEIREYAFHSALLSGEKILLGQDGGSGQLVGGLSKAKLAVVAKTIGSQAYVHTHVEVGGSAKETDHIKQLKSDWEEKVEFARTLRRLLAEIQTNGTTSSLHEAQVSRAKEVHADLLKIQSELKAISDEYRQIKFKRLENEEPEIKTTSKIYPNSFLTISGINLPLKSEQGALTFVKRAWQIKTK